MAAMMASTLAGSRPSEKLGTHSTSVDISGKDSWRRSREAREGSLLGHYRSGTTILARLAQTAGSDHPTRTQRALQDFYLRSKHNGCNHERARETASCRRKYL